jgi:LemA protein
MFRIIRVILGLILLSFLSLVIFLPLGSIFVLTSIFFSIFLISHYNNFVQLEEAINQNWADVDTALQKRSDLTARIVEILKGYARHEHSTLEDVTKARRRFIEARTMKDKIESAEKFEGTMGRLLLLVERYPELKANVSFNRAIDALIGLEEEIYELRKEFNRAVKNYNIKAKTFPAGIAFIILGFKAMDYFNVSLDSKASSIVFDYAEQHV